MLAPIINLPNWYWIVGGSNTQVYSTAAGDYVAATDPTYQSWLSNGNTASRVDSENNLGTLLAQYNLRPTNTNLLAIYQGAAASGINAIILKILFNHENRIRTLASQPTITAQQFITAVASLL